MTAVAETDHPIDDFPVDGEALPEIGAFLSGVSSVSIPPLATRFPTRALFLSTHIFPADAPFLSYFISPTPIDPSALYFTSLTPIPLLVSTPGTTSSSANTL